MASTPDRTAFSTGKRVIPLTARLRAAAVTAVLLVAAPVYFLFNPSVSFFPECPFHLLTGLDCPGCGSQRAFHALLHGHIAAAAGFNLLAVLAFPLLAYSAAAFIANHFFGRSWSQELFYRPWFSRTVLVAVLAFWLLRNLPWPCFSWMAS
jgi:hypothetical protein